MRYWFLCAILFLQMGAIADTLTDSAWEQQKARLQNAIDDAARQGTSAQRQDLANPTLGGIALRMSVSLVLVLLLIGVLYYLARKMRKMDAPSGSGGRVVQILETHHLGTQQKLLVLRVGERKVLVVGSTDHAMGTLAQLEGDEADKVIAGALPEKTAAAQFSETVNQMLSRFRREERA